MTTDVLAYLESKGLQMRKAPGAEYHTSCFFCDEPSNKGRLYINCDPEAEVPGLMWCHLCGKRGALKTIKKWFGDPVSEPKPDEENPYVRHAILQAAASYYHHQLDNQLDVVRWLVHERGLEPETIADHEIGWADGNLYPHLRDKGFSLDQIRPTGLVDSAGRDFFENLVTLPYHTAGNVVMIRGKQIGGKYLTPPGQKSRLFNSDVTWNAETLHIAEGEIDSLVLTQLGYASVGVPGANTWQDSWTGYFEFAKRVYVVFDNDATGIAGAEKVSRIIGPKARIVTMPEHGPGEKKNDPSEWLVTKGHTKEDFLVLLAKAKGSHLLSVDDAYVEWLEVQGMEGMRLGFGSLDAYLNPGILPAQVMVVLAKTGTGKTLFLLNCFERLLAAQPDKHILFISLEQTRSEWFERARRIHRFYNLDADDQQTLSFYRDRLLIVDKNQLKQQELVTCIQQYEYEMGKRPDLVAVDYLGYWARGFKGEGYERTSQAVMVLKAIAKDERIAILAPHQVSRMSKHGDEPELDSARESGVVEETADFVLALWAPDDAKGQVDKERTGEVKLRILKSRHGNKGRSVSFRFSPLSLTLVPFDDALVTRATAEVQWHNAGRDDFEEAIYMHKTGDRRIAL